MEATTPAPVVPSTAWAGHPIRANSGSFFRWESQMYTTSSPSRRAFAILRRSAGRIARVPGTSRGAPGRTKSFSMSTMTSAFFPDATVFTASSPGAASRKYPGTRAPPPAAAGERRPFPASYHPRASAFRGGGRPDRRPLSPEPLLQHLLDHLGIGLPPALLHHLPDEEGEETRLPGPVRLDLLRARRENLVHEIIQHGGVGDLGQPLLVPKRPERLPGRQDELHEPLGCGGGDRPPLPVLDRVGDRLRGERSGEDGVLPMDAFVRGRLRVPSVNRRGRLEEIRQRPGRREDPRVVAGDPVLLPQPRDLLRRHLRDRTAEPLDPGIVH